MIYFIPWGDKNTASSRLRVHNVVPYIKDAVIGTPEKYEEGDVLIIQKALAIDELKRAKQAGIKVIYDIDDNYLNEKPFVDMCQEADLVTVGSYFFRQYFPNAPIIDDSLDWDGTKVKDISKGQVGWHGYGNLNYIQAIAPTLINKGYTIKIIVQKPYMAFYSQYGEVKEWNLQTIDKELSTCEFCAFYLPEDDFSQAKGMNKLIKAWAIGIPAFVSPLPEYMRVMAEAGVDGFIVEDWENHDFSKSWEPKMREYALKFHPREIAKQWKKAIKQVKKA